VQASEPVAVTLSLPVVADNTIGISSINSSIQRTVFPVKGFTDDPGIAVGCIWSLLLDPFSGSNYQNFICAGGLVKFDLSAIAGRTVVSATLKLQTSLFGVGIVPRTWHLHALASPWSPAAVNWDNAPQQYFITSQRANLVPPNFTGQIYNIDVTTTVRNWASGQWANNGFALGLDDVSFPYVISVDPFEFYSNESAGGRGPQLIVTAL
jgi:hypothetical protein